MSGIPHPRKIPVAFYIRVFVGEIAGKAAWVCLAFVMMFIWGLRVPESLVDLLAFRFPTASTVAKISSVSDTIIVDGDQRVLRLNYRYEVEKVAYTGISYSTTAAKPGAELEAIFVVAKPQISRLVDGTYSPLGTGGLWLMTFPLLLLLPLLVRCIRGFKQFRLMRRGIISRARLVSAREMWLEIDDSSLMRCRYAFRDGAAREHTLFKYQTSYAADQAGNNPYLMYLEHRPDVAALVHHLPGVKWDAQSGQISWAFSLHRSDLVAPLAILWVLGSFFFFR